MTYETVILLLINAEDNLIEYQTSVNKNLLQHKISHLFSFIFTLL